MQIGVEFDSDEEFGMMFSAAVVINLVECDYREGRRRAALDSACTFHTVQKSSLPVKHPYKF